MNWLLLRGLAREQRHWGRFPGLLGARFPDGEVRGIDLPGTGTEFTRSSPASIPGIVDDARRRFLATRSGSGPWSLLGVSLGGMVAMQWCTDHPSDFAGVVLINTSAADLSAPWRRMDLRVARGVLAALVTRDPVARERRILGFTTNRVTNPEEIATHNARLQAERPVARATVLRHIWAASRFRAPQSLALPTLVLAGEADRLADPECSRRLSARFGAPLATCPGAGHDLALDDPEWLVGELGRWVDGRASAEAQSL
ncbi:MAG: alpha/beta hydrolase [Myxococcales bacterium]|nr:alpha/beta hydrolase [Myxococcales bacterium]